MGNLYLPYKWTKNCMTKQEIIEVFYTSEDEYDRVHACYDELNDWLKDRTYYKNNNTNGTFATIEEYYNAHVFNKKDFDKRKKVCGLIHCYWGILVNAKSKKLHQETFFEMNMSHEKEIELFSKLFELIHPIFDKYSIGVVTLGTFKAVKENGAWNVTQTSELKKNKIILTF